jgi:hypothetical protein
MQLLEIMFFSWARNRNTLNIRVFPSDGEIWKEITKIMQFQKILKAVTLVLVYIYLYFFLVGGRRVGTEV